MSKIKIGLVQINNSFSGQNYLPYSVGILQSYAEAHAKDASAFEFMLPVYLRERVDLVLPKLKGADIVFFSAYVWNFKISLEVARRLKQENPGVVTVMGGPHVPDRVEGFLEQYPFIDIAVHGEGERAFLSILENGLENAKKKAFAGVKSISYLDHDGKRITTEKEERLKDISLIPSPYTSGTFKSLMAANPQERWIVLWETNRGCPFSCAYCDWGSATQSKVTKFEMERIFREVDWFADHHIEFIFCADANFGMLERDYDIVAYAAEVKKKRGYPQALSVQNTKNATERAYKVQKLLSDSGLNKGVTIAFQSMDPTTLKNVKRQNISTASFQELQRRFTRDRIETYSDIILGLPGDNYATFVKGVCQVIENGQHNRIQFGNLSILPNAAMGDPEYQKQFGLDMVETPVVNIHGSLAATDNEVLESQVLVVGNKDLSREDWVKARSFAWMTALLHFNKVLQIPLLILHTTAKAPFYDMFTAFCDDDLTDFPVMAKLREFFYATARNIQKGGAEYVSSEKWLNIWWPADELALINLCADGQIDAFYKEAEAILHRYLDRAKIDFPRDVLADAIRLNAALFKRPFQTEDVVVKIKYNIWEVYQAARVAEVLPMTPGKYDYRIDRTGKVWKTWDDWCREVIWWGNKKGAYLYSNVNLEPQLSGHF